MYVIDCEPGGTQGKFERVLEQELRFVLAHGATAAARLCPLVDAAEAEAVVAAVQRPNCQASRLNTYWTRESFSCHAVGAILAVPQASTDSTRALNQSRFRQTGKGTRHTQLPTEC